MLLLGTALASQTHFPCAAPLAAARRSPAALQSLLGMDESCRNSAWHDTMGVLLEDRGMLFAAQVHYGFCAASRDHLLDQCLAKLSRTARLTGETSTLRRHLEGAGPELFRPEARDHLLLTAGEAALDEGRQREAAHLLLQVRPGSEEHPQARWLAGEALASLGKRGQAEKAWVEVMATAQEPWASRARLDLAGQALRRAEVDEARALLEPIAARSPEWERAQLLVARSYLTEGEPVLGLRMLGLRRLRGWSDQRPEGLLLRAGLAKQLCREGASRRTRREVEALRREHARVQDSLERSDPRAVAQSWQSAELPGWLRTAVERDRRSREGLQALSALDAELGRVSELGDQGLGGHLQRLLSKESRLQQEIVGRRVLWVMRSRSATVDLLLREAEGLGGAEGCR